VARTTIYFGVALIALGIGGYVSSAAVSITALIPAVFGGAFVLLGGLGLREHYRKHAMHAAAALGLIGFLGTASGLVGLVRLLSGTEVVRPAAVVAQSVMAILTAVFVGLCVKSFVDARRARAAQGG
jgi:hypothetical protein